MYPLDVIAHVVDAAEDTVAAIPVTQDTGVVLGLMASQILLAGEAAAR
jgi:hypothetical protein